MSCLNCSRSFRPKRCRSFQSSLLIDRYWTRVISFETLAEEGMIERTNLDLFSYADNAEDAWRELVRRGLKAGPRPPGYPSTFDVRE